MKLSNYSRPKSKSRAGNVTLNDFSNKLFIRKLKKNAN